MAMAATVSDRSWCRDDRERPAVQWQARRDRPSQQYCENVLDFTHSLPPTGASELVKDVVARACIGGELPPLPPLGVDGVSKVGMQLSEVGTQLKVATG